MPEAGRLHKIWIKRFRTGPMDPVESATLIADRGLAGNANQGGRRQVTLIEWETWQAMMQELETQLDPSTRRANLLLKGLPLAESRGRRLALGPTILLIGGETRPCQRMEEAYPGLRAAMQTGWRGGVFAQVLRGGPVRVGDLSTWLAD